MYLKIPEFKCVTIEHTNKCHARCPECSRTTEDGEVNPRLTMTEMTLEDYKRIAPPEFYTNIPLISFTGCFGDATASTNLPEVLKYLADLDTNMIIQTNGDFRPPEYYEEIAHIFGTENSMRGIEFSVDGLEDTNHIYRVNTNFERIMKNAEAFIKAGGKARWNVILFDHIAHQKEEIIQRAKDMGFFGVAIKKVTRSLASNKQYQNNMYERVYFEDDEFGKLLDQYGVYSNYVNTCGIDCVFKGSGQMYIDHQLNLWPCTPIGGAIFYNVDREYHMIKDQILKLIERYGEGFNCLKDKTIQEVLNHPWFSHELEESWNNTMNDENFKLISCAKACGDFIRTSGCAKENKEKINF